MNSKVLKFAILSVGFVVAVIYSVAYNLPQKNTVKTDGKMNLIVISIDSLRADHMSLYGYGRETTPFVNAWAKDAVVFNNYFSTSFLTPISETSVQTGRYPFSNGLINFESTLKDNVPTLAQILQQRGWQTAAFGSSPEFSGYPPIKKSLSRGFDFYWLTKAGSDKYNGRAFDTISASASWLEKTRTSDKPFYLWLSFGSVHWPYGQDVEPYFTSSSYSGFFKNVSEMGWQVFGLTYKGKKYSIDKKSGKMTFEQSLTQEDYNYVVGRYDDAILRTDRMLGELFAYLKKSGLDKSTVVVLQSEHGEGLGERGYIAHYDIFDEQVHTPLIIKAPGLATQRVDNIVSGVDIVPTALDLLKIPSLPSDGFSFAPFLGGVAAAPRTVAYITRTSLWERVIDYLDYPQLKGFLKDDNRNHYHDGAVRTIKWKLIHRTSRAAQAKWSWFNSFPGERKTMQEFELYDIQSDAKEINNVYSKHKSDPEIVVLQNKLTRWEEDQASGVSASLDVPEVQPYF